MSRLQKQLLFDWGDTLMRDDPSQSGPMCEWPSVVAMPGALALLQQLNSAGVLCHLATGAADSDALQIRRALARVGMERYIARVFCPATLGVGKREPEFYPRCAACLGLAPGDLVMLGDSLTTDVQAAEKAGLAAVWVHPHAVPRAARFCVSSLEPLCSQNEFYRWLLGAS